mmetsp:Transcript_10818/g.34442  ORF Transcript_10818/g.34442 Transcript_10818/m.34442 type:complete len:200 (-) Transcript_10818:236-835(-)
MEAECSSSRRRRVRSSLSPAATLRSSLPTCRRSSSARTRSRTAGCSCGHGTCSSRRRCSGLITYVFSANVGCSVSGSRMASSRSSARGLALDTVRSQFTRSVVMNVCVLPVQLHSSTSDRTSPNDHDGTRTCSGRQRTSRKKSGTRRWRLHVAATTSPRRGRNSSRRPDRSKQRSERASTRSLGLSCRPSQYMSASSYA